MTMTRILTTTPPLEGNLTNGAAAKAGEKAFAEFREKIKSRRARVCVMGLGYVGLPLVRLFASKDFPVTGFDTDANKINLLKKGTSYIKSVPSADIAGHLEADRLLVTNDVRHLAEAD